MQSIDQSPFFSSDVIQHQELRLIPIHTKLGEFNVWTHRIGHNPAIKVLLLAGGPGLSYDYLSAFDSYFPNQNIEYIYYDQLGCGKSDNPMDDSLYSIERSVEELEQVRAALNLTCENSYLYGHSWGGIVAMEYALKYQANIKGLIISNMTFSGESYNQYIDHTLAPEIPQSALNFIRELEANNAFEDPLYMKLVADHFYVKHVCRMPMEKWPEPVMRSLGNINHSFYTLMQGPSEFGIKGNLKHWSIETRLANIEVPTLFVGAKYDTMNPRDVEWMSRKVKNGFYLFCPNGSHLALYDDQAFYMAGLINFLKRVSGNQ